MNEDIHTTDISNRMLYDLVIGMQQSLMDMKQDMVTMKQDMVAMKQDMADMKQNIHRLEAKVDRVEAKVDRLEARVEKNTERIEELFLRGDKVKISFSRTLLFGNSFLAGIVGYIAAMFTGYYIMRNN